MKTYGYIRVSTKEQRECWSTTGEKGKSFIDLKIFIENVILLC